MSLPIELPKETLKSLYDELPYGSIQVIADKTGFHRNYVKMVFDGESKINKNNQRIILEAQKIIRNTRAESEKLNASINKTLSK